MPYGDVDCVGRGIGDGVGVAEADGVGVADALVATGAASPPEQAADTSAADTSAAVRRTGRARGTRLGIHTRYVARA